MIGLTVRALMAGCLVPTIAAGVTKAGPNLLRDQAASITCRPRPERQARQATPPADVHAAARNTISAFGAARRRGQATALTPPHRRGEIDGHSPSDRL
ncbi:MAG: hypothetical protein ABWY12_15670, partial [Burkholderiales bacterium]